MRLIAPLLALGPALLMCAACTRGSDANGSDTRTGEATTTRGGVYDADEATGAADVRITTIENGFDLALVGDTISAGLSKQSLATARRGTDTAHVDGAGFGADLEKVVKGAVQGAIGTRVRFPISDVRDVRYERGALVFDWVSEPRTMFDNTRINGKRLLESFPPGDAQRFADAVRARKAQRGQR